MQTRVAWLGTSDGCDLSQTWVSSGVGALRSVCIEFLSSGWAEGIAADVVAVLGELVMMGNAGRVVS